MLFLCLQIHSNGCYFLCPQVEGDTESVDKCVTELTEPDCQGVELTLPKQVTRRKAISQDHDEDMVVIMIFIMKTLRMLMPALTLTSPRQTCVELVYGYAETASNYPEPPAYPH